MGWGLGEGVPSPADYKGSGERRELPQRGPGQSPRRKRILTYFEGHSTERSFLYLPGEPKKIPPTTFVDITAMHGNFCTKFYTIVKRSNIHFITKFY